MSCRRKSLVINLARLNLRLRSSFSAHVLAADDRDRDRSAEPLNPPPLLPSFSPTSYTSSFGRTAAGFGCRETLGVTLPLGVDPCRRLHRNYSSSAAEGSNDLNYINDVVNVLSDGTLDTLASVAATAHPAPFPGEVAAAAADSFFPVAALQHAIDAVHSFTGLNWWACIALTTILIRGAMIPLLLNQMKASAKLNLMKPELEQLKEQMQSSMQDPQAMQESQRRVKALFRKHGVTPLTPLKGLFIQGPLFVSFFFAISNMVEKVPSLKGGGAFWFVDLTTPDDLYIFPVLSALTFLATVEFNMQEGMEDNPMADTMKNFSRVLGVLTVPFTANFPKAIFCYWVTSNLFSLLYGIVLRQPPVRTFLDLPPLITQSAPSKPPVFSFFAKPNTLAPAASSLIAGQPERPRASARRVTSSAAISQRIKNLEKILKARNKKRR